LCPEFILITLSNARLPSPN